MLEAYIKVADSEFDIQVEPFLNAGERIGLRSDFIVSSESDKIIIELKRKEERRTIESGLNQLTTYLTISVIIKGILFIPPKKDRHLINLETRDLKINDKEFNVIIITPGKENAR